MLDTIANSKFKRVQVRTLETLHACRVIESQERSLTTCVYDESELWTVDIQIDRINFYNNYKLLADSFLHFAIKVSQFTLLTLN